MLFLLVSAALAQQFEDEQWWLFPDLNPTNGATGTGVGYTGYPPFDSTCATAAALIPADVITLLATPLIQLGLNPTSTNLPGTDFPTYESAIGSCSNWAGTMASVVASGSFINAATQQTTACAIYHCLEEYYGFTDAIFTATSTECVLGFILRDTAFGKHLDTIDDWGFPHGELSSASALAFTRADCTCNSELSLAAPSPVHPQWLADTGLAGLCHDNLIVQVDQATFFGCALLNCFPSGPAKDYWSCVQDKYKGYDFSDCAKYDAALLANVGSGSVGALLGILGLVFAFLGIMTYVGISCCTKSKGSSVGV